MNDIQKKIIERYIRAYNSFDVEGMTCELQAEVIFENVSNGNVDLSTHGIDAFREQAEAARGYFTRREQKITSWNFHDGTVTVDIDYEAALAVALPNGLKAGDLLRLKGQSVFEFRSNKITKIQDRS